MRLNIHRYHGWVVTERARAHAMIGRSGRRIKREIERLASVRMPNARCRVEVASRGVTLSSSALKV
jgi:hypothetical protein